MIDLPDFMPLKISQISDKPGRKQIDAIDHLIAVLPENPRPSVFRELPKPTYLKRLYGRSAKTRHQNVTTFLDNKRGTAITLAAHNPSQRFATLTWARKVIAECERIKTGRIGIVACGFDTDDRESILTALVAAADAAAFKLPTFKSGKSQSKSMKTLKLLGVAPRLSLDAQRASALGNNIARWLTALPPNKLTAASYRAAAQALADQYGMKHEFLDIGRLKRL
ncbi:MAG: hypothetical protein ACWGPN_17915, partial [Gammaproteobacteria bacterium]